MFTYRLFQGRMFRFLLPPLTIQSDNLARWPLQTQNHSTLMELSRANYALAV